MEALGTLAHRLFVARAAATEDTLLDLATKGDFAQKPSGALDLLKASVAASPETPRDAPIRPVMWANGIAFMFAGSTAAGKTFNWHLKAWLNENGPAKYVAAGTGILGTQAVVKYPHNNVAVANMFWADTIVVTWFDWYKEVKSTTPSTARNSVSEVWLDNAGWRYWLPEIITTGTSDPATSLVVYYHYW